MCSHIDPPQGAKSRHEELKERARILLEQARKEAMLKNVTSSPEVTGQGPIVEKETPETPDNSPTQKELSPVCIECAWEFINLIYDYQVMGTFISAFL